MVLELIMLLWLHCKKISLNLLKIKADVFTCKTMSYVEFKIFQPN